MAVTSGVDEISWMTNGRLADGRVVDLAIRDGRIDEVVPTGEPRRGATVDLDGWLILPPMGEPHAHLDKALTADLAPNPRGDLNGAIEAWIAAAAAGSFSTDEMIVRVRAALDRLLLSGVTAVRSHINCGTGAGIWHLEAAQEAARPYRDLMHIEFVALMHSPLLGPGSADNQRALNTAVKAGVDLIGGCPHLEPEVDASISLLLDTAAEAGLPVDLHTDETLDPSVLTLRDLARQVARRDLPGRVTASHCVSLGMQPVDVQVEVAAEVAAADIAIVPLPQTNLFLQGREQPVATPRGLTALGPLRDAGVLIAAGADNVQDPFNLVGRSDPLETAALMVMAGHVSPEAAYDMVSNNVRSAMGLPTVTFSPGDPADFVAINTANTRMAIADAPPDRVVVHGGKVVAQTRATRTISGLERAGDAPSS